MSTDSIKIMGLFNTEDELLSVMDEVESHGWRVRDVHSPIPSERITDALKLKKSVVGWFTLVGGITGCISGFSLAYFAATRWNLMVGGKPIVAWFPFFVIAFEFTILFSVFGNIAGLITQVALPTFREKHYLPDCSGTAYGLVIEAMKSDADKVTDFFHSKGARTS